MHDVVVAVVWAALVGTYIAAERRARVTADARRRPIGVIRYPLIATVLVVNAYAGQAGRTALWAASLFAILGATSLVLSRGDLGRFLDVNSDAEADAPVTLAARRRKTGLLLVMVASFVVLRLAPHGFGA